MAYNILKNVLYLQIKHIRMLSESERLFTKEHYTVSHYTIHSMCISPPFPVSVLFLLYIPPCG